MEEWPREAAKASACKRMMISHPWEPKGAGGGIEAKHSRPGITGRVENVAHLELKAPADDVGQIADDLADAKGAISG